jgi:DNA topoisomerase-3
MLVIYAEKSSLAKTIAGVLGAGRRIALQDEPTVGYYQFKFNGEDAVICHGVGHLMSLVPAKNYDEKYQNWDLSVFPCIPENFRIAPKSATIACAKLVKRFLLQADWCINAADPDREGELIFSYVYQACGCHAPYQRVWLEDLTDAKIKKAFDNLIAPNQAITPQNAGTPDDLQMAGRARDIADWLIGNNLTVAATKRFGGFGELLSVGRVQTPTLALVVEREKAILNHVKTPFWRLIGTFTTAGNESFEAEYEGGKFEKQEDAQKKLDACIGKDGTVSEITTKHRTESAPLLYNATQLQIAANKKFGWDADKTTKIMQSLYEHKLMTYPRTSSEHLTEAMMSEVSVTIEKLLCMPEYAALSVPKTQWQKFTKRHFDDKKVGSHPAIIPTVNVPNDLTAITEDEKKLYDLLAKSLIRMIYPKAELDDTTAMIDVDGTKFKATGSVITNMGWYAVDAKPEKKKVLPKLTQGDILKGEYTLKEGETEPPKRYTEADLLAAMELAGQNIEDEEIRTLMKLQKKGLGTDATRAPILKGLFERNYLAKKGKSIYPTDKGMFLIETLPVDAIKSADLTGEWEMRLNNVAMGKEPFDTFVSEIKETTKDWFAQIASASEHHYVSPKEGDLLCPVCNRVVHKTPFGWGCTGYSKEGDGCKFTISQNIAGVELSDKNVQQLLKKGRTGLLKGFQSKSGKKFNAYLVLENGAIKFDFLSEKEHNMVCPICGKPMTKMKFNYRCSGAADNTCAFQVNMEVCHKKLSETMIVKLLNEGRTDLIKGFKSKAGKEFDAYLVVDKEEQKVKLEFPKRETPQNDILSAQEVYELFGEPNI